MAQLADIKANEVLLACAIGDLAWLKRGISGGSNPGATNREVSHQLAGEWNTGLQIQHLFRHLPWW